MTTTLNDLQQKLCVPKHVHQQRMVMNVALNPCSITTIPQLAKEELWHYRLGHAPLHVLINSGCISKHDAKTGRVCVVCPMAKFTRLPYNLSSSHAVEIFHLIHVDIWGVYKVETRGTHRFQESIFPHHLHPSSIPNNLPVSPQNNPTTFIQPHPADDSSALDTNTHPAEPDPAPVHLLLLHPLYQLPLLYLLSLSDDSHDLINPLSG
ncbi:unnamed protein product [Amaranthus hypochondriacus]